MPERATTLPAMLAPFVLGVASCTGAPAAPSAVAADGPLCIDGLLPSPDSFDDRALEALGAAVRVSVCAAPNEP